MSYVINHCPPERYGELLEVFHAAVHHLTALAYDAEQRAAWAPDTLKSAQFSQILSDHKVWTAESGTALSGFASLTGDGRFGLLYVHPHFGRQGIGSALIGKVEAAARASGRSTLAVEASLIAAPVFRRCGWSGHKRQGIVRNGVTLENIRMEKFLGSAQ